MGKDFKVGLVLRQPAICEQRFFVSPTRYGLLVDAIPPPLLASIEPILVYFHWGIARDGNILRESLVVIVDFEAFCTDACDVIRAIVCVEDVRVDLSSCIARDGGSRSVIRLQWRAPDAIAVSLVRHDSKPLCYV